MIYPFGLQICVRSTFIARTIAVALCLLLVSMTTVLSPGRAYARQNAAPVPVVLIFPFTNNSGSTNDGLTTVVAGKVRQDIDALGYYRSTGFTVLHPSIQRALYVENTISLSDLSAPTASPDRAQKIANIVGTPFFLIGNIDTVSTDSSTGTVTVALDGSLYNSTTGAVVKQINVTGIGAPASKDFDPDDLLTSAIGSATGQLVSALFGPRFEHHVAESAVKSTREGTKYGEGLLFILTIALALVLINNHGGHHSGGSSSSSTTTTTTTGGTTGPPAPPL